MATSPRGGYNFTSTPSAGGAISRTGYYNTNRSLNTPPVAEVPQVPTAPPPPAPPASTSNTRGGTTPTAPTTPPPTTQAPNPYAPATNYGSPYYVESTGQNVRTPTFGGPVLNQDGSVSTGMPDSWGAFGFNPFANWSGVNSDTGQNWNVGDRFLNEQGAQKLLELLGINSPIITTSGAIRDWTSTPGAVYGPSSGTTTGPNGVGMYRYVDPTTGQLQDLSAYAPLFLSGRDDIAKWLFQNQGNPLVQNGYQDPMRFTNLNDYIAALTSQATSPGAQQNWVPPTSQTPQTPQIPTTPGTSTGDTPAPDGRSVIDSFIQLLQGIYQGSNPFTIQNFNTTGNLGTPNAPFGQDYLDGLQVLGNFTNLGDQIASLLTPKDLFDVSPTGMYANFGPAAYLQRALYPEFYV